jgi:carboxyl-terminal processing protease
VKHFLAAAALLLSPASLAAQGTSYEQLQAFSGVLSQIRANYVDSVETAALVRAAITGMLASLDPHSYYVSRSDFEVRRAWDDGRLAVTGLLIEDGERAPVVVAVQPASPAQKAGVMAGDRVLQVDGVTTTGRGARAVELQLLGDKGSKVQLLLERGPHLDPDTLALTLKRSVVQHQVVPPPRMVSKTVGYVRLEEFTMAGVPAFKSAVKQVRSDGAKVLIIDLRGNPGGDVGALVEIAAMFLPAKSDIIHAQGRKKTGLETVSTKDDGDFRDLPLIVLVDEGSASASEMLAGALQDHDRALIVGRRTFGKALMQMALPLPNGDVVWLTTSRIASPSGRVIQRSYSGVEGQRYRELAGKPVNAADTLPLFHTHAGRPVRGGGGIAPDVVRESAPLPTWFSTAADTGLLIALADSVAMTLPNNPAARDAWMSDPARWDSLLVTPLLVRVRSTLGVRAEPDAAVRRRLGRILAARVAEVRWGPEAGAAFEIATDPDIAIAVEQIPRLPTLLGPP